jgi:hypothetical protein
VTTPVLTICTVSYYHRRHLERNIRLAESLNPGMSLRWVIVDNTPPSDSDSIERLPGQVDVEPGYPPDPTRCRPRSHHHGLALNRAVCQAETRYALILDPDFYIVRPNWVRELMRHAADNGLAFFGVPWHPRWVIKYRYFPCVHCMLIDLSQVDRTELDFTPPEDGPDLVEARVRLRGRIGFLTGLLLGRRNVARSQDTGSRVYRRYGADPRYRSECVPAVWPPPAYPFHLNRFYRGFNRAVDDLCPDRYSYVPKRPGYFTTALHQGVPPDGAENWEYFSWRGTPFGFHIRGMAQAGRDRGAELRTLELNLARYPVVGC